LRELSPKEIACVQCRVGMLRLWNPFKPDGAVQLVLSRYEERRVSKKNTVACIYVKAININTCRHVFSIFQIAKIFIGLALNEPGENWKG
jgi:hypothetical protein